VLERQSSAEPRHSASCPTMSSSAAASRLVEELQDGSLFPEERLAKRREVVAFVRSLDPGRKFAHVDGTKVPLGRASDGALSDVATQVAALADEREEKLAGDHYGVTEAAFRSRVSSAAKAALAGPEDAWLECLPHVLDAHSVWHGVEDDRFGAVAVRTSEVPQVETRLVPGLRILPGAIPPSDQARWIRQALRRYGNAPFRRNIDLDGSGAVERPWEADLEETGERRGAGGTLRRLTWATVGMAFDWKRRVYVSEDEAFDCSMPPELAAWAQALAGFMGTSFEPEAGIVNFFHVTPHEEGGDRRVSKAGKGNTMGGHKDDSELATDKPVISMSLGCSAVFLIGGGERSVEPIPLLLRSGDVILMGGESRLAIHGIACVIPHTCPPDLFGASSSTASASATSAPALCPCPGSVGEAGEAAEEEAFQRVSDCMRVNINVRQVYPDAK
jgi:DNA alkylation damage repair protein AlkB